MYILLYNIHFFHTGMPYALGIFLFQKKKENYVIILNGYMSHDIVNSISVDEHLGCILKFSLLQAMRHPCLSKTHYHSITINCHCLFKIFSPYLALLVCAMYLAL